MTVIEEGDGAQNLVDNKILFQKSQTVLLTMIEDEDSAQNLADNRK